MSKQYYRAFEKAAKAELEGTDYELEILKEMIGTGSPDQIDKALDSFFGFHDVELVTGIATRYGLQHSIDKFNKREVPFIMSGLGEHYIPTQGYNDQVFVNSIHLWQQVWYLGYYTGKNMGDKGVIFASMYDSGYSFLSVFQQGLMAANPDVDAELKLMPMLEPGKLSPVAESFENVNFEEQDFVFSILCGEEATLFLDEFKKRGLHEKTALLGLPFLLEPGKTDLSGLAVHSTHHQPQQAADDPILKNVFTELGHTAGKALAKAIIAGEGEPDRDDVAAALASVDSNRTFPSSDKPQLKSPIAIVKHEFQEGNAIATEVLETKNIDLDDDEALNIARDEVNSSWVNPYLAI